MQSCALLSASAWTEGVNCVLQTVEDSLSSERALAQGVQTQWSHVSIGQRSDLGAGAKR
ncbi:MAG: hypothetical protein ACI9HB_002360, partial [Gammaproteobacteria bacterium]